MIEYEAPACEEIEATIDRARFDILDPAAIRVDVIDSFRRQLGECRPISRSNRDSTQRMIT